LQQFARRSSAPARRRNAAYRRVHRKHGALAQRLGLPQPSYESIRLLVRDLRKARAAPGIGDVLLDITLRNKPPEATAWFAAVREG